MNDASLMNGAQWSPLAPSYNCTPPTPVFIDTTATSGLPPALGRVYAIFDYDKDGLMDLAYGHGNPQQVGLWHNNGDLTFTDVSVSTGFTHTWSFGGVRTADLDNDGWTEYLIPAPQGLQPAVFVLRNLAGTFIADTIHLAGNDHERCLLADIDRDGFLDLVTMKWPTGQSRIVRVYWNPGPGQLWMNTTWAYTDIITFPSSVSPRMALFDYDNDGDQDILAVLEPTAIQPPGNAYYYHPIAVYNNMAGNFIEDQATGLTLGHRTLATTLDLDNDGDLDLVFGTNDCCQTPEVARVYGNNGNGTFTDLSSSIDLTTGSHYFFAATAADIENDGDEDVYWMQGAFTSSQLYVNSPNGFSGNVASDYGLALNGDPNEGIVPYWFDADNDGDLDVLCTGYTGTSASVKFMVNTLMNNGFANHLQINLVGCASGYSALNSMVLLYHNGTVLAQSNSASSLLGSKHGNRIHFGLGSDSQADSIIVQWASGNITKHYGISAGQLITIHEDPSCTYSSAPGLALRILLEGPYDEQTGSMRDDLRQAGLIPLDEPFTSVGYFHVGQGGNETTTPAVLAMTGDSAIVDWVVLELRDPDFNGIRLETRSALVQRDGDIVDVDGTSPITWNVTPGAYFLCIKHRNHLGVMTAAPVVIGPGLTAIDFTLPSTPCFGTEARKVDNGIALLWAGDVVRNGQLKYTGASNDRDPILQRIGGIVPTLVLPGYHQEDVNLDGLVKYTGNDNDRDIILQNIGGTVPTATRNGQTP